MYFSLTECYWDDTLRGFGIFTFNLPKEEGTRHLLCIRADRKPEGKWNVNIHFLFGFNYLVRG